MNTSDWLFLSALLLTVIPLAVVTYGGWRDGWHVRMSETASAIYLVLIVCAFLLAIAGSWVA